MGGAGQEDQIVIDPSKVIRRRYKLRKTGQKGRSFEATIPLDAFEREARRVGLTPEEFMERYVAVWHYDNFDGLLLTFEPTEESE